MRYKRANATQDHLDLERWKTICEDRNQSRVIMAIQSRPCWYNNLKHSNIIHLSNVLQYNRMLL